MLKNKASELPEASCKKDNNDKIIIEQIFSFNVTK